MAQEHCYTLAQQLACIAREIKLRQYAYPRRVQNGSMSAERAAEETGLMQAVLASLKTIKEQK